jgi:hypothetical protein
MTFGLASRAPVTLFDESHLGMDAPSRAAFHDEVLSDFMAHPRTIVISTHLIDELSPLFEEVVIIDNGRLVLQDETEVLRARGADVTGPAEAVDRFVAGHTVLRERQLGRTKSAMSTAGSTRRTAARPATPGSTWARSPSRTCSSTSPSRPEDPMSAQAEDRTWSIARLLFATQLPFLVIVWVVFAAAVVVLTVAIHVLGTVSRSVWDPAVTVVRWFALGYGVYLVYRLLPVLVAHGRTRREFLRSIALFVVAAGAVVAALLAAGFAVEGLLYRVMDLPQRVARERLSDAPTQYPRIFLSY